ncbi:MAG: Flp pilus assembly protein CpaB, partial [Actinomycetota bacterium]
RWEDMKERIGKQSVPADLRPATAVTTGTQLNGRTSARAISRGEIVTTAQFNTSASGGLDIPAGHNAITVNVAVPQGVARYVQPGAFINVYASFKGIPGPANPTDTTVTRLILSKIKVLANQPATLPVERSGAAAGPSGDILLTVAVTPDQAEKLIFAKENGSLWFGLVNAADGPASTGGRTFKTALS